MNFVPEILGGLFTGFLIYFIGMWIYLIYDTELRTKSTRNLLVGIIFITYFGLSLWGLLNIISTNPTLVITSILTFIYLIIKYPWWKN